MNNENALRKLLSCAVDFAKNIPGLHLPVNSGHLLLAILDDDSMGRLMLSQFGIDLEVLKDEIYRKLKILITHPGATETFCQDPLFSGEVFLTLHHARYGRGSNNEPALLTIRLIEGFVINKWGIASEILRNLEVDYQRIQKDFLQTS